MELMEKSLLAIIGDNIKNRRHELGVTQKQLAIQVGLTQPRIAQIEKGQSSVPVESLADFSIALETDPASLVTAESFTAHTV